MIGVCTIWCEVFAIGLGQKRWYNLYKQAAKAFGATHLLWVQGELTVPVTADQEIEAGIFGSLAEVRATYPSATFVFLDAPGSVEMSAYSHPEGDTVYVVGTDMCGLGDTLAPDEGDQVVSVSTSIELWSHMAAAIALYDRQAKSV